VLAVEAPARVLVVEDEAPIRDALTLALQGAGYVVQALHDARTADASLDVFRPDLAVLDVLLPSESGLVLARRLRRSADLPIIFLTARDAASDRLAGFDAGGDDYVVKPFVMEELLARVRAVLRRSGRTRSDVVEVADLIVDEGAGQALRAGIRLELTATELRLLGYLARHRARVLSKLQLLTQVWGYDDYDPNVVEVHVSALRRKLEQHGPRLIHTERGLGYVLRAP
jgi:two-component system, OmpR family, response regulator